MKNIRFALVTGASQGIGLACAKRLHQDGCRVIGVDIYKPTTIGAEFADFLTADVSNSSECNKAVQDAGQIDILVNSAGIVGPNMPFCASQADSLRCAGDQRKSNIFHN